MVFKRINIRGLAPLELQLKLEASLRKRAHDESLWLIDDKEPIDCYAYLIR